MEEDKNSSQKWVNSLTDLVDAYRNLISVKIVEHTSLGISLSIIGILSLIIAVFVLLFTGIGSAWWLGEYLQNMKAGFFIIAGFYALIFIILLLTSPGIWIPRIRNAIIKKIYEQN
jgi:uncharacterized protein YqhQ